MSLRRRRPAREGGPARARSPCQRAKAEQCPHHIQQRKNLLAAFREHGGDDMQPVWYAVSLGITVSDVAGLLVKLRRR